MRTRTVLVGAGMLALAVVAASRKARHENGADEAAGVAPGGWATCSAPSALVYERTFGWLRGDLYRRMADDLAGSVTELAAPEVLEIGPGPGGLAVELARRHAGVRLTGVDIDPAMVERATLRARREELDDRLAFVAGDVATLPFPDASFDLVTSSFSAHHWPDGAAGFAEIRRVLRPAGRAIVYDLPDRWGRLETKAQPLAAAATAGGFADAVSATFPWPGRLAFVRRLEVPGSGPPGRAPSAGPRGVALAHGNPEARRDPHRRW